MMKVGITGQSGFIGSHLYNYLNICDNIELVPFNDEFFIDNSSLDEFVLKCDVIVHLAAMNRHQDQNVIYQTNIELVEKLLDSIKRNNVKPHLLFSSSTQEDLENLYGKSKRRGRELFEEWAIQSGGKITSLIVPNVFGPFGMPNYNSFIATFCYKLVNNETPVVIEDNKVKLIFVQELVEQFYNVIKGDIKTSVFKVPHTSEKFVTEILSLLLKYKYEYFENSVFPELNDDFERNLFNTFRCYFDISKHYPVYLKKNSDDRGSFVETVKLNIGGQVSFSTTKPGITRGNHYHTRKIERFAVIKGKALIQLRRIGTDEVLDFYLDGDKPSFVDMPIWYTHNIINIGEDELYTIFWINEHFNPNDPDTFFEEV